MIHTARQTGKFIKLVRLLRPMYPNLPIDIETVAVGILERLWHLAITSAQRGDIGKLDNETIAESVGWFDDANVLIELLCESGWLTESTQYRLVIPSWSEHAPGFIKKNIARKGGFVSDFVEHTGSVEEVCEPDHPQASRLVATPNVTQPNPTQPNQIPYVRRGVRAVDFDSEWEGLRPKVQELAKAVSGDRRLKPDDRELAIKATVIAEQLGGVVGELASTIETKRRRDKPPDNPWAYFKAGLIRVCNESGLDFNAQWQAITVPENLLRPPKREVTHAN